VVISLIRKRILESKLTVIIVSPSIQAYNEPYNICSISQSAPLRFWWRQEKTYNEATLELCNLT